MMRTVITYEVHGGNLTGCGVVGPSSVGVPQSRDSLLPVIHGQQQNFVVLSLGEFDNLRTRI